MNRIFFLVAAAPLAGCFSAPKFHDARIAIDDARHARVTHAELLRAEDGWVLEGVLRGPTFAAAPHRTVVVESFDEAGTVIASERVVAFLGPAPDAARGADQARFLVAVPAPELAASYAIRVVE